MIFVIITYEREGNFPEPKEVYISYIDIEGDKVGRSITPREGHLIVNKGVYLLQKGYNANILEIKGENKGSRVVISLPMNECLISEVYKD